MKSKASKFQSGKLVPTFTLEEWNRSGRLTAGLQNTSPRPTTHTRLYAARRKPLYVIRQNAQQRDTKTKSEMSVSIRTAKKSDLHSLSSMQKLLESEGAIWGFGADPIQEWEALDLNWLLVAEEDELPVGYVFCVPREYKGECVFPEGSRILEILEIYVRPASRRDGVGHELVSAVQARAEEEGFSHLRLYSASKQFDDVVRFYRDCGFNPWYLEMVKPIKREGPSTR